MVLGPPTESTFEAKEASLRCAVNLPEDQRMQLRGATRLHDQHIANRPGVSGLQVSFAADSAAARDGAELGDMDLGYHAMA